MPQQKPATLPRHEDFGWLESSVPQILWIAGADGKMRFLSKEFTDLTGLDAGEVINGDHWKVVVHPRRYGSLEALWRNARAGACESRSYFGMRLRTGHDQWMQSVGPRIVYAHRVNHTGSVASSMWIPNFVRVVRSLR